MSEIDYAARVAKGAALLDEKRPGWERELDLGILDIADGTCCVTAQLSGQNAWYAGMRQLDLNIRTYTDHGFRAEDDRESATYDAYDTLNTLWKDLISKRLATEPADS